MRATVKTTIHLELSKEEYEKLTELLNHQSQHGDSWPDYAEWSRKFLEDIGKKI